MSCLHKDDIPVNTIKRIEKILCKLGIELEETWIEDSGSGIFSLRVTVKNTQIGTNGKGISKDLAKASAYAEFMERIQNKILPFENPFKKNKEYIKYIDEKYLSLNEVLSENNSQTNMMLNNLGYSNLSIEDKLGKTKELLESYELEDDKGAYLTLPFYSVKYDKVVNILYNPLRFIYGSHGMCAGNTPEEAMVQGISEIYERYVQKNVILNKYSLPDIPDSYVENFPDLYRIYLRLKSLRGFNVQLKDASLGGEFPVVCLSVISTNSKKHGVIFGSHPVIKIAIERVFTEALQGRQIDEFAKMSELSFENKRFDTYCNLVNIFSLAYGEYPFEFFNKIPSFKFSLQNNEMKPNKDLLFDMLNHITEMDCDTLIRDVSFLGFPSFQIIVPGLSELEELNESEFRYHNTRIYIREFIKTPSKISKENIKYIIPVLEHYKNIVSMNNLKSIYRRKSATPYPFEEEKSDIYFFLAICYIFEKDYTNAKSRIEYIKNYANLSLSQYIELDAYSSYLSGMNALKNHNDVLNILSKFYDDIYIKKICKLENRENIFNVFYNDDVESAAITISNTDEIFCNMAAIESNSIINQIDIRKVMKK